MRKSAGFTLIELMVGLVLVGLILAALGGALRTGILASELVESRTERIGDIRLIQAFLRRQIQSARPVSWTGTGPNRRKIFTAFDGAQNAVSFIGFMPPAAGRAGLHQVRIQRRGGNLVLIKRITSGERQRFDFSRNADQTVLLSGISRLRFGYFGASARDAEPRWHDKWTSLARLPELVKIDVDFVDSGPGAWPQLVAQPMIASAVRQ